MKQIDDSKIRDVNTKLEESLKEERDEWQNNIITLIKSIGSTSKLAEAQVYQLSYRQQLIEKLVEYGNLLDKRVSEYDKLRASRFRELTINYDIKLSSQEKNSMLDADCSELKRQTKMLEKQISFVEASIKTLDNLGFAIKNKIEILSQQLF